MEETDDRQVGNSEGRLYELMLSIFDFIARDSCYNFLKINQFQLNNPRNLFTLSTFKKWFLSPTVKS